MAAEKINVTTFKFTADDLGYIESLIEALAAERGHPVTRADAVRTAVQESLRKRRAKRIPKNLAESS